MIAASLIDLGIDKDWLIKELAKLRLKNYQLEIKKINKKGIKAVRFIVRTQKEKKERGLKDIYKIIDQSSLDSAVKRLGKKIFLNLAKAEAKAHKSVISKVHFHEVGAADSIIDIVASSILINALKPQKIYASVTAGALIFPAAKELLKGIPITIARIDEELVTPTGAAILKTIVDDFLINKIDIKINKKGYGAGAKNFTVPNVLESVLGETKMKKDKLIILETNIDDMNPQFYAYVIERLIKKGAREAFIQPIVMKKSRLGTLLTAICDEKIKDKLIEIIFDETTTFGIRANKISRVCLDREFKKIKTKYGPINIKIGKYKGKIRTISPEYDDCEEAAAKKNIPVKEVYDEVKKLFKK